MGNAPPPRIFGLEPPLVRIFWTRRFTTVARSRGDFVKIKFHDCNNQQRGAVYWTVVHKMQMALERRRQRSRRTAADEISGLNWKWVKLIKCQRLEI